jgi:hypothetical protein
MSRSPTTWPSLPSASPGLKLYLYLYLYSSSKALFQHEGYITPFMRRCILVPIVARSIHTAIADCGEVFFFLGDYYISRAREEPARLRDSATPTRFHPRIAVGGEAGAVLARAKGCSQSWPRGIVLASRSIRAEAFVVSLATMSGRMPRM